MTYVKAIRRRVEADLECCLSVINKLFDFFLVCYLGDKSSPDELFVNLHFHIYLSI